MQSKTVHPNNGIRGRRTEDRRQEGLQLKNVIEIVESATTEESANRGAENAPVGRARLGQLIYTRIEPRDNGEGARATRTQRERTKT